MESAMDLWYRHLVAAEANQQFVDCKLLDEIIGKDIVNKFTHGKTD
jgi:hypothetical protein